MQRAWSPKPCAACPLRAAFLCRFEVSIGDRLAGRLPPERLARLVGSSEPPAESLGAVSVSSRPRWPDWCLPWRRGHFGRGAALDFAAPAASARWLGALLLRWALYDTSASMDAGCKRVLSAAACYEAWMPISPLLGA